METVQMNPKNEGLGLGENVGRKMDVALWILLAEGWARKEVQLTHDLGAPRYRV